MATAAETRKQDGRQRLYDAAAKLFSYGGYEEVSVAQILEESSLKAPSLYHHYQDKEGLYVSWAVGALDRIAIRLKDVSPRAEDPSATLLALVEALVEGPDMDILQLLRDLRAMKKPGSRENLMNHLNFSVYKPVAEKIAAVASISEAEAMSRSRLLVHAAMNLHPAYGLAGQGITPALIVKSILQA